MKHLLLIFSFLLSYTLSFAQIEWIDTVYNFGTFHEESGIQYGKIRFVNISSEPTSINRVKTTCGCTVADYPKDEIMPGDTAIINFSFNPEGRLGKFEKAIRISYGFNNETFNIKIRGRIIGKSNTLKNQYPIDAGALRLNHNSIIIGDITKGKSRHEFIHIYNQSNDTLCLGLQNVPPTISAGISDEKIFPGDIATISLYFNSIIEQNLGLNIYKFDITTIENGITKTIPIEVTAYIKEQQKNLSQEDVKNAPMIFVDNSLIDLGNITADKKIINASFQISNEGKSELKINRIYSIDKSIKIKRMPSKISAGKKYDVDIEINPELISSTIFNIRLEIISNDPLHPTTTVRVVGQKK